MTTPDGGGSEGISWIDVTASAAGISEQFKAIGSQAAAGFSDAYNAEMKNRMQQSGQQGASLLGQAFTQHLTSHIAEAAGPLKEQVAAAFKSVGVGGPAGEAEGAGSALGGAMTAGIVGAVVLGAKQVVDNVRNVVNLVETEAGAFAKVGEDAGHTLISSFGSAVEGKAPNVSAAFGVVEEAIHTGLQAPINGINTVIDNTVGHIPIIGEAFKAVGADATEALSGLFEGFDTFKGMGGEVFDILESVGNEWTETARTIAGQTLGTAQLSTYMNALRNIGASGAVEDLHDAADSIGALGQRLSDLDNGAGLTQQQLQELATTFAQGGELLGYKLNVDDVTAAFSDFGVGADHTNDTLLTLINTARLTGSNFNDVMQQVDGGAPVFQALGYNIEQTTFVLGKINQELGSGAANRWVMSVANADEKAHKLGLTWTDVLNIVNDYVHAGDKAGAVDYLKGLGMGAKQAQTTIDEVSKGILVLPDQVQAAMDGVGPALHEPLDDVLDQTETLADRWEAIGGELSSALAPLGLEVTGALGGATSSISTWVQQNQATIVGFVGKLVDFFATGFGDIARIIGDVLKIAAPVITGVEAMVVGVLKEILGTIDLVSGALSHLPLIGDQFRDVHQAASDALGTLHDLPDLGDWATKGGNALQHFSNYVLPGLKLSWDTNVAKAEDIDSIGQAFQRNFLDPTQGQTESKLQNAFTATKDGLKLLGDPSNWAGVHEQLAKLGIDLRFDDKGDVTGITAQTQAEADALTSFWAEQFGRDHPLPVHVTITNPNPQRLTPTQVQQQAGIPSELIGPTGVQIPSTITPPISQLMLPPPAPLAPPSPPDATKLLLPPQAHASDYVPVPGQIQIQPAANRISLPDLMDSAGVAPSLQDTTRGVVLAASMKVQTSPTLDPDDVMSKAGIPTNLHGDLPNGSTTGVVVPAALDLKDNDRKSLSELMDAAGVPSENQGDTGITIPTSFSVTPGAPGAVSAGDSSGGGQGGPVVTDGTQQQNARAIIQLAQQRGYDPEATQAILATGLDESGLSQSAVSPNGLWRGVFQQDASYPGRDSAATNISGFFDRLGPPSGDIWEQIFKLQQGTPYGAPNARNEYMGEIRSHLGAAQQLYGQLASSSGAVPPGYGGGGPAGGLPGASVSYTPDWLIEHGIKPIFEKNPGDPGGAATPGEIPAWVTNLGAQFDLTPKDHDDRTLHGGIAGPGNTIDSHASWAFDFFGAADNMQKFADYLSTNYANQLVQLIHQDPATGRDTGVAGGQVLPQGAYYTTPGGSYSDESDEVHVAFASEIGAGGPASTHVQNADYTGGDGAAQVVTVDRITTAGGGGTPGLPTAPAPTAPGSTYGSVPPPPGMQQAAPGDPNAIATPYGQFDYTFNMPAAQQALLTPEQRQRFDTWLQKYERQLEQQTSTQTDIDQAKSDLATLKTRKDDADAALAKAQAAEPPGMSDADRAAWEKSNEDYIKAKTAATEADKTYAEGEKRVTTAQQRQHDEQTSSQIEDEAPPPWEKNEKNTDRPDRNAEDLGKGLVKGMFQELGFPDVFGKPISEWGITKLLTGGAGYGLGLLQNMGQKPTGLYAPGGPLAALAGQTPGGSSSSAGGTDSAGTSLLEGILPGLSNLMHPTQGTPATPAASWQPGGAPTPPAATAAGVGSATAPIVPASYTGQGTTSNNPLNVTYNANGFTPSPPVQDVIRTISHTTSSPQLSGGAGVPV